MGGKYKYYFPGGNTPEGFVSYYDNIMPQDKANRIFCIKGGPGTGKSTLMKSIGMHYLDRGENVDFLKCSSDPDSMDGIVLKNRGVSIIDGTAPHITDPVNPGVIDEIIDFIKYIDEYKINKHKDEILKLSNMITEEFKHAYVYLKCASVKLDYMDGILKRTVDDHTIYEILTCIPEKKIQRKKGFIKKLFGSAITSGSLINEINGLAKGISDIYILDVPVGYDTGSIIKELSRRFMFWGYDVEELYCPMKPMNDPEHFISYDAGVAVFTCNNIHDRKLFELDNVIYTVKISHPDENTSDFLNYYNLLSESKKDIDKAVARLSVAKKMHDELEAYYVDAMDFDGISDIRNKLISKINRYL